MNTTQNTTPHYKIVHWGTQNNYYVFNPSGGGLFLEKYSLGWTKQLTPANFFPSWEEAHNALKAIQKKIP